MTWSDSRPRHDAWVGVDPSIGRYVASLEIEIGRFESRQEELRLDHREEIARLQKQLAEKDREIGRLSQALALARERLNTTSRNSSTPPSVDPLSAPRREPGRSKRRERGGQRGHEFHPREFYPVEQCASVTDHKVDVCRGCGVRLEGDDPDPIRHQIVEMPPIVPIVEEHRLHAIRCADCGAMNRACLPSDVTSTGFGPGVEGTVATLVAECRLSHRLHGGVTQRWVPVSHNRRYPVDRPRLVVAPHDERSHLNRLSVEGGYLGYMLFEH